MPIGVIEIQRIRAIISVYYFSETASNEVDVSMRVRRDDAISLTVEQQSHDWRTTGGRKVPLPPSINEQQVISHHEVFPVAHLDSPCGLHPCLRIWRWKQQ